MRPIDRLVHAIDDGVTIDATHSKGRICFHVRDDPPRTLIWTTDDAELNAMTAQLRHHARSAFGSGNHGWDLLIERVQEELLTFTGVRGVIRAEPDGRISTEDA
ncbi:hypothetical protein [Ruania halotolerans]|uniref:hypothetical protein n=1 Tax=Ruania halotolerans TaxID=2897773 RepID=UPI001E5DE272|nr:hypothetical protein [Ruania halotolerans]UFU05142.1 hypothetical protein LQF10_11725 [Ruania halotolerans]